MKVRPMRKYLKSSLTSKVCNVYWLFKDRRNNRAKVNFYRQKHTVENIYKRLTENNKLKRIDLLQWRYLNTARSNCQQ